jgi:hypothetical protein
MSRPLEIAGGDQKPSLLPQMANPRGSLAGATGTGKSVSMQVLVE